MRGDLFGKRVSLLRGAGIRFGRAALVVALLAVLFLLAGLQGVFAAGPGTVVDAGFENGVDGATLTAPWVLQSTPQHAEYDSLRAKNGSTSAWIQGPASTSYAGVREEASSGMTSNGAEIRFWAYFDTTNQGRLLDEYGSSGLAAVDRAFTVWFDEQGRIDVYTQHAGNPNGYTTGGYTPVSTYTTGWTQFRIVYDFTAQTYTLSKRANAADPWTPIKAPAATGYNIPFRGTNTITQSHGTLWRAASSGNMWLDDVCFSDSGITGPDIAPPSPPSSLLASDHPGDGGGAIDLSWAASTDDVGVVGYKVFRGTIAGTYDTVVTLPVAATTHTDGAVVTGTRYYYAVTALDAAGNESTTSPEASAIAAENIPPATPSGLVATGGNQQVDLSWTANAESDLAGYNLYRNGVKVNAALITSTTHVDTGLAEGTSYSYRLSAVDVNGNESGLCTAVIATTLGTRQYDTGFENGVDGATLGVPWVVHGTPQRAEYDSLRAKNGLMSAWIKGPASTSYAGAREDASGGMSSDGAEIRFWAYFDTRNQGRLLDEFSLAAPTTADRAFSVWFDVLGRINVYTQHPGNPNGYTTNAYTPVSTYTTGWTQFRIVYDFTRQTFTLSKRSSEAGSWTQLKAPAAIGYNIPFRGTNTITQSHGMLWRTASSGNMWLDDVCFSDTGITDSDTTPPSAPSSLLASDHPGDGGGAIDLSWSASTDNVGVTRYKVYRGTTSRNYDTALTLPTGSTFYTDSTCATGVRYYYAVAALDAAGNEGAKSPESSAITIDTSAPSAPSSLLASDHPGDEGGAIDLSWSASTDNVGVTRYKVYRGTTSRNYDTALTLPLAVTTHTDSTCATGVRYYYAVAALDAAGNEGAKSPESSAVPRDENAPAVPSGLAAVGGTQQVELSWSANTEPDLAGYDLYRNGTKVNTSRIETTTFTDTGLLDGITYRYCLSAVDTSGNHSGLGSQVVARTLGTPPFDGTFENGSDGTTLPATWTPFGTPQHAEIDSSRAHGGAQSAWIQGPTNVGMAGVAEDASTGMTSDGAEIRFWVCFDNTTTGRILDDYGPTLAGYDDSAYSIAFRSDGLIWINTNRPGNPNGYTSAGQTQVGKYTTGWTEFRIVFDFTSQTYTLSKRARSDVGWTPLRAAGAVGYGIPFRGTNSIGQSHGTRWSLTHGSSIWLDDYAFSDDGMVDPPDTTPPPAPVALLASDHPADAGDAIDLSWSPSPDSWDVTGYKVYRGTAPGAYDTTVTASVEATTYNDSTCVAGTRYYYAVAALDAAGNEGAKSPEASAVAVENIPPAIPAGLAATGGNQEVDLSWTANTEPDLAGYNVYRDGTKVNAALITPTTHVDTGLADGTTYGYRVSAVDVNGNESPQCSMVSATTLPGTTPPISAGFENGSDGTTLTAPWVLYSTPQHAEYDNLRAKNGSMSAWIQGPASTNYAGPREEASSGMTSDGAEIRFWAYFDTTNQGRLLDEYGSSGLAAVNRAFTVWFDEQGRVNVYTQHPGNPNGYTTNAYTPVSTYTTGWTQFRIVYDFTGQTYTLSKRANAADPWTQLKATAATGYDIPFRGTNTITQSHGTLWRATSSGNLWLDDVCFSDSGITGP